MAPPNEDAEDEGALLTRVRAGDEAAFASLVRRHQQDVYRLALRMLGQPSEAEDVAQEVFVSLFLNAGKFEGRARLSTWLYRVTVNHCHNRLRYLRRRGHGRHRALEAGDTERAAGQGVLGGAPLGQPPPRPEQALEGRQLAEALRAALDTLGEEHRTLLVLRDLEQLSYERICEITQLPLGTVKSRLHRARLALAKALKAEQERGPRRREGHG